MLSLPCSPIFSRPAIAPAGNMPLCPLEALLAARREGWIFKSDPFLVVDPAQLRVRESPAPGSREPEPDHRFLNLVSPLGVPQGAAMSCCGVLRRGIELVVGNPS
jgi:hypothetical protein